MKTKRTLKHILIFTLFAMSSAIYTIVNFGATKNVNASTEELLTFTALESNSSVNVKFLSGSFQYSTDNGENWITGDILGTDINLNNSGDKVLLKGTNCVTNGENHFTMTGKISATGDVTSLVNCVGGDVALTSNYCFLAMFSNCTSLVMAPNLPSTTLTLGCYRDMFNGCDSLTTVPELSATVLTDECYRGMFFYCSSLTYTPNLLSTQLAPNCYRGMFRGCSNLTQVTKLPAENLTTYCYSEMFSSCSKLVVAPDLPATQLAHCCYYKMFSDCASLVFAPQISATSLATGSCNQMFYKCNKLNVTEGSGETCFFTCPNTETDQVTNMFSETNNTNIIEPNGNTYYYNVITKEPTATNVTYNKSEQDLIYAGESLYGTMSYALSNNSTTAPVDGWSDEIPTKTNAGTYYVWYKNIVDIDESLSSNPVCVTATINKADAEIDTSNMIQNYTYTGNEQTVNSGATLNHNETTLTYSNNTFTNVGSGIKVITISAEETENYNHITKTFTITIKKAQASIVVDQTPLIIISDKEFSFPKATSSFGEVYCDTKESDLTILGEYTLTYIVDETENYYGDSKTVKVTFTDGKPFIKDTPIGKTFTYDGSEKISIDIVDNPVEFGTMYYAVNQDIDNEPEDGWSIEIPKIKYAGTYYIWYKVEGDENYYDIPAQYVTSIIYQKEITIAWKNLIFVYNGEPQKPEAFADQLYGDDTCTIEVDGEQINAGQYIATAVSLNNPNYKLPKNIITSFTIQKTEAKIDTSDLVTSYVYNGLVQEINSGAKLNHNETTLTYIDNTFTNVGLYEVTISADETTNYNATSKTVKIIVDKVQSNILEDGVEGWTYGEEAKIPNPSSDFGTIEITYSLKNDDNFTISIPQNAGEYIVKLTIKDDDNIIGCEKKVSLVINKKEVSEPTVEGTYVYTGKYQSVNLLGVQNYIMTTNDSLTQMEVGTYVININLDDNYKWKDGDDGIIEWEIRAQSISSDKNEDGITPIIIETSSGFTSNMNLYIKETKEDNVKKGDLLVDYYDLNNGNVQLTKNERVGYVVDVKIIQEIDGKIVEIQPNDILEGSTVKIKLYIPDSVDVNAITRILHVHSDSEIDIINFDITKLDGNRYYEIEVDSLSEFAILYEQEKEFPILLVVIPSILLISGVAFLIIRHKRNQKKNSLEAILG